MGTTSRTNRRPTQNGSSLYHRGNQATHSRRLRSHPSSAGARGEDTGPGAVAEDEREDDDASQGAPGRPMGAAGTSTGAGRATDCIAKPAGGSATTGGTTGDAGGAASANRTSTPSTPVSSSSRSGGNPLHRISGREQLYPQCTRQPDAPTCHTGNKWLVHPHNDDGAKSLKETPEEELRKLHGGLHGHSHKSRHCPDLKWPQIQCHPATARFGQQGHLAAAGSVGAADRVNIFNNIINPED
ncbi:merozoite surface protein 2-like [Procambarus clarkii]|uniref:merozoite surface protein 2-like n=1 Tax=Procambarus clarkii TaxID=6728 RepID=UPI0037424840